MVAPIAQLIALILAQQYVREIVRVDATVDVIAIVQRIALTVVQDVLPAGRDALGVKGVAEHNQQATATIIVAAHAQVVAAHVQVALAHEIGLNQRGFYSAN